MQEFLGTHTPRLDEKGRLFLPARYRADLSEALVITTGPQTCPHAFPPPEFHRTSPQIAPAPSSSKNVRDIVRVFRARAHSDTPDRQGRVTIPAPLRSYAGLDRECTVIGNGSRLEVWDTARWEAYLDEVMPAYSTYSVETEEAVPGL